MSRGRSGGAGAAHEEGEARDVVGQILEADLGVGAHRADRAHITGVHRRFDVAEDVLDPHAHARTFGVGGLLFRRQRLVAISAFVDAGRAALFLQPLFLPF